MSQSIVSPFNARQTRNLEINPMINHFAQFQSALFSFNNDALFIGGRKATVQQLVPLIAKAQVQLNNDIVTALNRGSLAYAQRLAEDVSSLDSTIASLCLRKDVAHYIANHTSTRG